MQNFEENTQQTHTQQHRSSLVVLCCCCCCCCFVHHKWTKQKFTGSHSKPSHTVYCVLLICMWSTEADKTCVLHNTGSHSKPSHTVYCILLICGQQRRIKPVCYIISQQLDHSVIYQQYHCGSTFTWQLYNTTWQLYNTIGSHSKFSHISSSCCCCSCYSII